MKTVFSFVALLLLFAGCRTSEPYRQPYGGETRLETHTGVGLNVEGRLSEDGSLDPSPYIGQYLPGQDMKIVGALAATTSTGMPRVQFSIESVRDKPTVIQYRFTWMDADGFVIQPDQNPWQTVHLAGREIVSIDSIARAENARAFRLMLRSLEFKK